MKTASTHICERISQELSDFKHGTVIGCHLCNKSIWEISLLLNIPRSAVSGIITKWKQLGTTATQPPSSGPCKMTAGSMHAEVHSAQISTTVHKSFKEWVSMTKQLHPSLTSPSAMQSIGCSGVMHA
ncbi:unnamed protein product, partial [Staurois parvus]